MASTLAAEGGYQGAGEAPSLGKGSAAKMRPLIEEPVGMKLRIRGNSLRLRVARPNEVSVEGSQPSGRGKVLQILLEKDEARHGQTDASVA